MRRHSSQLWVNEQLRSQQKKRVRKGRVKKRGSAMPKKRSEWSSPTAQQASSNTPLSAQPGSWLKTISTLAQRMDLLQIGNKLSELNQVMEQVNGFISQLQQMNRHHPRHPGPMLPPHHQPHQEESPFHNPYSSGYREE